MFDNIGYKIKTLALIVTLIGIICSIIYGIALISNDMIGSGVVVIIAGSVISWVSSFVLYGIGEIIDLLYISNRITYDLYKKLYNDTPGSQENIPSSNVEEKVDTTKPKDSFFTKKIHLGNLKE